jgi:hypothetical protein
MNRYIDANAIDFKLPVSHANEEVFVSLNDVKRAIAQTPTADVAPRSEIAREIIADMYEMIKGYENIDVYLDRIKKKYESEEEMK